MHRAHTSRSAVGSRRALVGAGLAPLLWVCAAACTSANGPGSAGGASNAGTLGPRQIVLASVDKTESLNSASISLSIGVSGTPSLGSLVPAASGTSGTPLSISISGHGAFDFVAKNGEMDITVPSIDGSSGGTLHLREIGQDLYITAPQISSLDGGKNWVHVNAADYVAKEGQTTGPLGSFSSGDPSQVLAMLKQLGGTVTVVGPATVGGVATTEYRGSINLAGGGSSTGSTVLSGQLAQALGLSNVPVDVWVDDQGRARQVSVDFSLLGMHVTAQVDFTDFGTPVSVSAPPASDVAEGTSLLNSGQLGNLFGSSGA